MENGMQSARLHMLSLSHTQQLPGLSLTMTDRALSPIDWRRAERYGMEGKNEG